MVIQFDGVTGNPWQGVAPRCAHCHATPEAVVSIETGWRCLLCHRMFDETIQMRSK